MAGKDSKEGADTLTPQEMRGWLKQEISDSEKAFELRIKESTEFVTAYERGDISAEEAKRRFIAYDQRWGEALFGASAGNGISDDAILRSIDAAREEALSPPPTGMAEKYARKSEKRTRP